MVEILVFASLTVYMLTSLSFSLSIMYQFGYFPGWSSLELEPVISQTQLVHL